jgi:hypothetical protein
VRWLGAWGGGIVLYHMPQRARWGAVGLRWQQVIGKGGLPVLAVDHLVVLHLCMLLAANRPLAPSLDVKVVNLLQQVFRGIIALYSL